MVVSEGVKDGLIVDQAQKEENYLKGVFAFVAEEGWKFFEQQFTNTLPILISKYIRKDGSKFCFFNFLKQVSQSDQNPNVSHVLTYCFSQC